MNIPRSALLAPAVFGAFDGSTSAVGVLLTSMGVAGHAVFAVCFGLAVAGGVGMAAGMWLSDEDPGGPVQALVIGGATMVGTLAPALPYLWTSGHSALIASGVILVLIGVLISWVRSRYDKLARTLFETFTVLILVCAAVAACALATGGAG